MDDGPGISTYTMLSPGNESLYLGEVQRRKAFAQRTPGGKYLPEFVKSQGEGYEFLA